MSLNEVVLKKRFNADETRLRYDYEKKITNRYLCLT